MPTRKHLSTKLLPQRHSQLHGKVTDLLQLARSVCATLDLWTNRQMRSYLGVTCHFIIDFRLYSVMLACKRVHGSHTGEVICQHFDEVVDSFGLTGKVEFVVTDNASNMKKAFKLLDDVDFDSVDECPDEEVDVVEPVPITFDQESDIQPSRISCFAHTLQLVIKDGFKNAEAVTRVLEKMARLVKHVRHSSIASDLFEGDLKLQMSNVTRWNSQLTMIRSVLRVDPSIMDRLDYSGKLNLHETNIAKDLVEILAPFEWATNMTQGQGLVTASAVIPIIRGLRNEFSTLVRKFRMKMVVTFKDSIEKRLEVYEKELAFQLAAALDPRWKLAWCNQEEAKSIKEDISKKLLDLTPSSSSELAELSPPQKRSRYLSFMADSSSQSALSSDKQLQVDEYFSASCVSEDDDPLTFWKLNQQKYPELAKLATQYLQFPASSAPVERLFSIAGKVFRPERCSLSDERFEQLMFIQCNNHID